MSILFNYHFISFNTARPVDVAEVAAATTTAAATATGEW